MSTTSLNTILNQANTASQGATSRTEADKDMFLKLLVAQLTHQDPLNPVEDKEFIAQLAQFTSVEELQNIGKGINKINEAYDRDQLTSAAAMLGMRVISEGNTLTKVSDPETGETGATTVWYTAPRSLSSCAVSILHPSSGQIVYSEELGPRLAGDYAYEWNGRNNAGVALPDGVYEISVIAYDEDGRRVLIDTQVYGDVVRVEKEGDMYFLAFLDGRRVKYTDVNTVGFVQYSQTPNDDDSGSQTNPDPGTDPDPNGNP